MSIEKNCIVAQSGGPTVAINASLAGVLDQSISGQSFTCVYGSLNGITGILDHRLLNLTQLSKEDPEFIDQLKVCPSMFLGSCRFKLPSQVDDLLIYEKIFAYFEELNIDSFFYIGGNDSMDTVLKLSEYAKSIQSPIKIIGIPKTIDNDLCQTDHTPGFGSAAKYIASTLLEIAHDTYIYQLKSVTIVEIMGRDAGWLTAASALARNNYNSAPHLIYLPEVAFNKEECIQDVSELLQKQDNVIIAISEGIRDKDGNYISATSAAADTFGHSHLSGAGKNLEYMLKDALGVKVRSLEINVLQRCAAHLSSLTDLNESMASGAKAVSLALDGVTGAMVTINRTSDMPYTTEIDYAQIAGIANEVKNVPRSFINERGNDVTEEMLCYLRPLIMGEPEISFKNGLPSYLDVSHLI